MVTQVMLFVDFICFGFAVYLFFSLLQRGMQGRVAEQRVYRASQHAAQAAQLMAQSSFPDAVQVGSQLELYSGDQRESFAKAA